MTRTPTELGELGEVFLDQWATTLGGQATRPKVDSLGWDRLVQLPLNRLRENEIIDVETLHRLSNCKGQPHDVLELSPTTLSAYVQVKSLDKQVPTPPKIKLSNWNHLLNEDHPVFFLVLSFVGKDEPQEAWLIHIDEKWMKRALKRIIKCRLDKHPLNSQTHGLRLIPTDRLASPDHKSFAESLCRRVDNIPTYAEKKKKWRESTGYSPRPDKMICSFDVSTDEKVQHLVDFSIGLVKGLPTTFILSKERFGIEVTYANGEGTLDFSNDSLSLEVEIRLAQTKGDISVNTKARMFHSSRLFSLPGADAKLRLVSDIFEAVVLGRLVEMKCIFPEGLEEVTLERWYRIRKMLQMISTRGDQIRMTIQSAGNRPYSGSLDIPDLPGDPVTIEFLKVLTALERVAHHLDVPDSATLSQIEIDRQAQQIIELDQIFTFRDISVGFTCPTSVPDASTTTKVAFLINRRLDVGRDIYGGVLRFNGDISKEVNDALITFTLSQCVVHVIRTWVITLDEWNTKRTDDLLAPCIAKLESDGYMVFLER